VTTGGTPPEIIATLNRAINAAVKSPGDDGWRWRASAAKVSPGRRRILRRCSLRRQPTKWVEVVKAAGIKIE